MTPLSHTPASVRTPQSDDELASLMEIVAPVFRVSREDGMRYAAGVGRENFRMISDGSAIAGGLALLPMGQFFGGRSVPMTGVAFVGIASEHRGRGAATGLMRAVVREMHEQGVALSTLYPATLPLYRRAGYEFAGGRYEIRINLRSLTINERTVPLRRATADDLPAMRALHAAQSAHRPGWLDRNEFIWGRIQAPRGEKATGFVVNDPPSGDMIGYLWTLQRDPETPNANHSLFVSDIVALNPPAGRRLLTFLADHASLVETALFAGTPNDPLLHLLPERGYQVKLGDHWMARLVNVERALAGRGYPADLRTQVHLDILDDLIPDNQGRFTLEVADGEATVERGGRGALRMDVRGLASLYTGHLSPRDLLAAGLLEVQGANAERALTSAESIFRGPLPTMREAF